MEYTGKELELMKNNIDTGNLTQVLHMIASIVERSENAAKKNYESLNATIDKLAATVTGLTKSNLALKEDITLLKSELNKYSSVKQFMEGWNKQKEQPDGKV